MFWISLVPCLICVGTCQQTEGKRGSGNLEGHQIYLAHDTILSHSLMPASHSSYHGHQKCDLAAEPDYSKYKSDIIELQGLTGSQL